MACWEELQAGDLGQAPHGLSAAGSVQCTGHLPGLLGRVRGISRFYSALSVDCG